MMKYNDFAAFLHLKGTIADVDQIWIEYSPSVCQQYVPYQKP